MAGLSAWHLCQSEGKGPMLRPVSRDDNQLERNHMAQSQPVESPLYSRTSSGGRCKALLARKSAVR